MKQFLIILAVLFFIGIILYLIYRAISIKNRDKKQVQDYAPKIERSKTKKQQPTYAIKENYLSYTEQQFFNVIKKIVNDKYLVFPQIPLSQIIIKNSESRYQNELYRIIDFCIFDKNYHPLLCIEINDETHRQKDRYIRDKKVENLLNIVGLPLITLWTDFGIKPEYIERRIKQHIEL